MCMSRSVTFARLKAAEKSICLQTPLFRLIIFFSALPYSHPAQKSSWTNTTTLKMLVSDIRKRKTHTHNTLSDSVDRLEEWTNVRNTKRQYSKQLRNLLKVSILSYQLFKQHLSIQLKKD